MCAEEVHDVYLEAHDYCYPIDWVSDEVFNDITRKFYDPLRFLANFIADQYPQYKRIEFKVYVMPSNMNRTYYAVIYEDVVLFEDDFKVWNFWFESEDAFNQWFTEVLDIMVTKLLQSKPFPTLIQTAG
jgi:hypothetical protein